MNPSGTLEPELTPEGGSSVRARGSAALPGLDFGRPASTLCRALRSHMGGEGIHFALSTGVEVALRVLAAGVEWAHGLAMLLWAVALPLLLWHGCPRLSRVAMWFSIVFVVVSVGSHQLLGQCVLTALAGYLWQAAGGYDEGVPFVVSLTQRIAGFRPSARAAVLAWELAIAAYSIAVLWCWRGLPWKRPRASAEQGLPGR